MKKYTKILYYFVILSAVCRLADSDLCVILYILLVLNIERCCFVMLTLDKVYHAGFVLK